MRTKYLLPVIAIAILALISACTLFSQEGDTAGAAGTAPPPTPSNTPVPAITPAAGAAITPTLDTSTLTVWVPPELFAASTAAGSTFSDHLLDFSSLNADIQVKLELKPVVGQGSILSYLRAGRSVAGSILPDLVALPTGLLPTAASEGLIYPLTGEIDSAILEDLYPAAVSLSQWNGLTVGYPFALTDLPHLVYDPSIITGTLPTRWAALVDEGTGPLIIAAAGEPGARLVLQLYLASGGSLFDESRQPRLELEPTLSALKFISQGRASNAIALQSSNAGTLDEAWRIFDTRTAILAQTTADYFLGKRLDSTAVGFGPVPGPEGPSPPLVRGWVWAISTPDAVRRAVAADLLTHLVTEPVYGRWALETGLVPARRQAFAQWNPEDPYTLFLQQELERAIPDPLPPGGVVMTALADAVFDVVSLAKTPQAAAQDAVNSVGP